MHVIWKRPDGFHGANPTDFIVADIGSHAKIWLHKREHAWFPFQIAGDWQESEGTQRLNYLVNLLSQDDKVWNDELVKLFNDTMGDDAETFIDEMSKWVGGLLSHLKGDTWEVEIMRQVIGEVERRLIATRGAFLKRARAE